MTFWQPKKNPLIKICVPYNAAVYPVWSILKYVTSVSVWRRKLLTWVHYTHIHTHTKHTYTQHTYYTHTHTTNTHTRTTHTHTHTTNKHTHTTNTHTHTRSISKLLIVPTSVPIRRCHLQLLFAKYSPTWTNSTGNLEWRPQQTLSFIQTKYIIQNEDLIRNQTDAFLNTSRHAHEHNTCDQLRNNAQSEHTKS